MFLPRRGFIPFIGQRGNLDFSILVLHCDAGRSSELVAGTDTVASTPNGVIAGSGAPFATVFRMSIVNEPVAGANTSAYTST